jgi:cytochrome c peroxidase
MLTDGVQHELGSDLPHADTPSLIGLAASAPYFHDGSAATLRAVLMGNGTVHNMGRPDKLSPTQIDDLIAYLETL